MHCDQAAKRGVSAENDLKIRDYRMIESIVGAPDSEWRHKNVAGILACGDSGHEVAFTLERLAVGYTDFRR
ncbi:MAG: hypothetical protein GY903_32960 [Fuerstiella sp.]|nr:hypothetical protein [Fuerstiella sp.]MCP4859303.1 hypothetical protein [Fuerstiella sp.]